MRVRACVRARVFVCACGHFGGLGPAAGVHGSHCLFHYHPPPATHWNNNTSCKHTAKHATYTHPHRHKYATPRPAQPSQFQLHLQVILPPFLPAHWDMFQKGVHFTRGRFVPLEFLVPALSELSQVQHPFLQDARDRPLEDVFDAARSRGIDYDAVHAECFER